MLEKTKINEKEAGDGPFFKKNNGTNIERQEEKERTEIERERERESV